ncbi:protein CutA homolog [Wyeomyia smithii]|uniref:protein CutA homolog n=1 Tax=Wyeomyia smithii TaxID=174621 RepID=UPI002468079E|nr:protein CutA homolog [Wyeomyia smithii]XP_055523676.1 protein CutA homolog [Wyeomyia smithii]XP_055523677.1 protein CutA homolog [Wyeomyia smithii]
MLLTCTAGSLARVLIQNLLLSSTIGITTATGIATMSTEASNCAAGLHSIAYVTTPNEKSAKELARKIVEQKLAACVNIIPGLTSVYEWEGKINEDHETLLMVKTRTSRVDDLSKFVRENHPYSVAEVISVPIENGNPPYLEWLSKTVPERKTN